MNHDLPTFVVMNAKQSHPKANTQAISAKLWSAGFLSPEYAGVGLRAGADPVLYLSDPEGVSRDVRRRMLDGLGELNQIQHEKIGSSETLARIAQYEMAFRMQSSVPEMADLSSEPESTFERWGEEAKEPGSFPNTALNGTAARRARRPVRPDLSPRVGRPSVRAGGASRPKEKLAAVFVGKRSLIAALTRAPSTSARTRTSDQRLRENSAT